MVKLWTRPVIIPIFLALFSLTQSTGQYVDVVIWSSIETYTAVICACLMCVRPLITKFIPSAFPSTNNSCNNTSNGNRSLVKNIGSGGQNSPQNGRGIEMSGEDKSRSNQVSQARSQITVTTENRISFETKRASEYLQMNRDMDDNETLSSEARLTKR